MPMNSGQLETTMTQNVRLVPVDPHVKSTKTCKLFNVDVNGKSKSAKSADPSCYDVVTVELRTGMFENQIGERHD